MGVWLTSRYSRGGSAGTVSTRCVQVRTHCGWMRLEGNPTDSPEHRPSQRTHERRTKTSSASPGSRARGPADPTGPVQHVHERLGTEWTAWEQLWTSADGSWAPDSAVLPDPCPAAGIILVGFHARTSVVRLATSAMMSSGSVRVV